MNILRQEKQEAAIAALVDDAKGVDKTGINDNFNQIYGIH
jgi:hypothetical protein